MDTVETEREVLSHDCSSPFAQLTPERYSMMSSPASQNDILINQALREMNDKLLVLAAKTGNRGAFVELCERHSKKLLSRIYRITKNWADAEDVLQDSLLKA